MLMRSLLLLSLLICLCQVQQIQAGEPEKRILIVLSNVADMGDPGKHSAANNLWEVAPPHHVFIMHGYKVDFVSPKGGKVPFSMDVDDVDPPGMILYTIKYEGFMEHAHRSMTPAEVDAKRYSGVFIGGGAGPLFDVADNRQLMLLAARIYDAGGVVGGCGHGPGSLGNVKLASGEYLVAGKQVTGFPNSSEKRSRWSNNGALLPFLVEDRLRSRGGKFLGKEDVQDKHDPVIDSRLVTAMFLPSCAIVAEEMMRLLR